MLSIYKASAGSGKTFQLVVEYLKLLLENPFNYKHILAVTFTNKATNEMKTRILETLNNLAQNYPSDYIIEIQKESKLNEEQIRKNAKEVLRNILHDYNRFSISTIDSFTQRTIKAFNRELGISPNYKLELNSDIILSEATDRLIAKISKDQNLLNWLKEFSKERIRENKSQRIELNIKSLGKELFKESFQMFFPEGKDSVYTRQNLLNFKKELNALKSGFEKELKLSGEKWVSIIQENQLGIDDFIYGKSGVAGFLNKIALQSFKTKVSDLEYGKRVQDAIDSAEKWYKKTSPQKDKIHHLVEKELHPLLKEIIAYIDKNLEEYFTVLAVLKEIRTLGILTDLKEEIQSLLREKGILQISDSNLLLSKIIDQSDSPFIYEKTGNYYKHFMLDEFQDTSGLQWNNFKPLILNSLAEGRKNLLVGDVKQSIYRWRNSDYKILAEKIYTDFNHHPLQEIHLGKNWRSDKNIIEFNNKVFEDLKLTFEESFFKNIEENNSKYVERSNNIYNEISQIPGKKTISTGQVKVYFSEANNFQEQSAKLVTEQIKQLQDQGIKASETAIIVRKNKEGKPIIKALLEASALPENKNYNFSVISNESLFLNSSQAVLFIIEIINHIISPENKISKTALLNLWFNGLKEGSTQKDLWEDSGSGIEILDKNFETLFERELTPTIEILKKKILLTSLDEAIIQICSVFRLFEIESELPFIQTIIDKAGELKSSLSNDLSNFLFWWNENGQSISVNVNEEVDSINLLTVHKSKGLEYKAVIIPYFDWKIVPEPMFFPILWCKPETKPFDKFPLLPVKYGNDLKKSLFRKYYFEEYANSIIDVFNLAYVAFTRAKSVLFVNCPQKEQNKRSRNNLNTLNHLLYNVLQNMSNQKIFEHCWKEENTVFEFGTIPDNQSKRNIPDSVFVKKYRFNDFSNRVKLRNSGEDFLIPGKNYSTLKNKGKIIHQILATINDTADIESSCLKALNEGIINESEMADIIKILETSFSNPQIAGWFNGKYKVINERNLLSTEKILRPDRIMIHKNEAIVVDYKSGNKKSENYNYQVKRYAKVLKETGFEKVTGFLWYINQNEVDKVCEI